MAGLQPALQRGPCRSGIGLACQHFSRNPRACWATSSGTARRLGRFAYNVPAVHIEAGGACMAPTAALPDHTQPGDPHTVGAGHEEEEQEQGKGKATRAYQYVQPWKEQLLEAVESIQDPGTFAYNAAVKVAPYEAVVMVKGVGRLAYPLCSQQAAALVAVGEPAPCGEGTQTVLDFAVTRETQVDASLVTISPSWAPVLQRIKQEALSELGIGKDMERHVEAHLYKLLLYEPGGHFKPHTDTEKEPGMFATLIVQLPAGHEGGSLEVQHAGRSVVWDSAKGSDRYVQYAAFYADCEHQLHPVTSGHRLVLAYNLVRISPGPTLQPIDNSPALEGLCQAVSTWESQLESQVEVQSRVAVRLDHRYTRANVSFSALKGRDMAVVQLLQACDDLEVHLVVVTKTKDEDDGTSSNSIKLWVRPGGTSGTNSGDIWGTDWGALVPGYGALFQGYGALVQGYKTVVQGYGNLDVGKGGEMLDGRALFASDDRVGGDEEEDDSQRWGPDGYPDDTAYTRYTGKKKLFYHRTLAVIWPRSRSLKLAKAAGYGPLLDLLALRVERPLNQGDKRQQVEGVVAVVKEVVDAAAKDPNRHFSGYGGHALRSLQLLRSASRFVRKAGDPESVKVVASAAVLVVSVLTWSEGVQQDKVGRALADLATELKSPSVDKALVALVAHCAPEQVLRCVELASETYLPHRLKSPLAEALLTAVLAEGTFAALPVPEVCAVARFVCRSAKGSLGGLASAVLGREDRQGVLKQVLQEPLIRAALMGRSAKHLTGLFTARVQALELQLATPPTFSWEMPNASVPQCPQVELFLRGHAHQKTFTTDASQPDHVVVQPGSLYGLTDTLTRASYGSRSKPPPYSVVVKFIDSHPRSATILKITKTKALYKAKLREYEANRQELLDLRDWMALTQLPNGGGPSLDDDGDSPNVDGDSTSLDDGGSNRNPCVVDGSPVS